jgi:hypothetical protein
VTQPLLHLGDIGIVTERVGIGGDAQCMRTDLQSQPESVRLTSLYTPSGLHCFLGDISSPSFVYNGLKIEGSMTTIHGLLESSRARQVARDRPFWPPDLFAVCGTLLKLSGAYLEIFKQTRRTSRWKKSGGGVGCSQREGADCRAAAMARRVDLKIRV